MFSMTPSAARAAAAAPATLPDGRTVVLRPLGAGDVEALVDFFDRLSDTSRYLRFLTPATHLTPERVLPFADVDHHDHVALAAIDPDAGHFVGTARFVRSLPGSDTAEIALTVADEWQGCGLGTLLLQRLVERAREEGVVRFTAEMLSQNRAMGALFRRLGDVEEVVEGARTRFAAVLPPRPAPLPPAPRRGE